MLESFGAGNAPRRRWLYDALKAATDRGIIIVNKTPCSTGSVEMGRYETSLNLINAGVISGYDNKIMPSDPLRRGEVAKMLFTMT